MRISSLTLGPVETNCYFIENEDGIIIVDPAGESGQIIKKVNQLNKTVKAVLLTHAHFDHIAALDDIVDKYQVPVYMSAIEFDFLNNTQKNGSAKFKQFGLPEVISDAKPQPIEEGKVSIEGFEFEVLHTPGHSPGSLTFVFNDFAVVGDTLFKQGIGRTDLYKGDYETLVDSIQDKLFELEGDLPLFPGHGPYTTVDDEQLNPFLHG